MIRQGEILLVTTGNPKGAEVLPLYCQLNWTAVSSEYVDSKGGGATTVITTPELPCKKLPLDGSSCKSQIRLGLKSPV